MSAPHPIPPYGYTLRSEVSDCARWTCARLGYTGPPITWQWSGRMTNCMGKANGKGHSVKLSRKLWPRATEEQRRHTIVHEVCHVVAWERYQAMRAAPEWARGRGRLYAAHGTLWASLMRECGEQPLRCHTVDNTGLTRKQPRFPTLECTKCGHVVERTLYRLRQDVQLYARGSYYWHKRDGAKYALHPDAQARAEGIERRASLAHAACARLTATPDETEHTR